MARRTTRSATAVAVAIVAALLAGQTVWAAPATAPAPLTAPPVGPLAGNASVNCPQLHIFGARETTAPPGFGSSQAVVDLVTKAFPGTTSEAINYPAAGGTNEEYAQSVTDGIVAVLSQVQLFAGLCPKTILIMHGYSQVSESGWG